MSQPKNQIPTIRTMDIAGHLDLECPIATQVKHVNLKWKGTKMRQQERTQWGQPS